MSLHDAYARLTPFELAFPDGEVLTDLATDILDEAALHGADPSDPESFVLMGAVGAFLRTLRGPDAPPEAVHQFGALTYHGLSFMNAGCPLYVLGIHATRYLVEGAPSGSASPLGTAGYVQLPQHLFWLGGADAPESVDGIFWTVGARALLHTALVTGVRPDRDGFGVVALPGAPVADASDWLTATVRPDGADFAARLPGAELDGLYAFEAAGEVLQLLARLFAHLDSVPGAAARSAVAGDSAAGGWEACGSEGGGSEAGSSAVTAESAALGPARSRLTFTRVGL